MAIIISLQSLVKCPKAHLAHKARHELAAVCAAHGQEVVVGVEHMSIDFAPDILLCSTSCACAHTRWLAEVVVVRVPVLLQ